MGYFTKSPNTKVFNPRGTHSATIRDRDTDVTVSGAQVVIPAGRGLCFPISDPFVGFVKVGELRFDPVFPTPDPDPDPEPTPNPYPVEGLYQFGGDPGPRSYSLEHGVGAPDVLPLADRNMIFTPVWQAFVRAINPRMTENHVRALYGKSKAYFNRQGDAPGENYNMPKTFTSGYSCHEGVEVGNELVVRTLNGNLPPPDAAVVNPATRPHLFFHATIVRIRNGREARYPFPHGAPAWGYLGNYVFMPLVSRFPVRVPLSMAHKVTSYVLPYTER